MSDAKLCFKMRRAKINSFQNFLLFVVVCWIFFLKKGETLLRID